MSICMKQSKLLVFSILVLLVCCKPSSEPSNLQSLENFAAGSVVNKNNCSAAPALQKSLLADNLFNAHVQPKGQIDDQALANAKLAATSLPRRVRDLFHRLGGRIVVASDVVEQCNNIIQGIPTSKKFFAEGKSVIDSCALLLPESQDQQVFEVFIADKAETIQHGLIRQFGLVTSQILSRVSTSTNAFTGEKQYWLSRVRGKDIEALRNRLVQAFLIDIYEKPQFFKLNDLDIMLGQGAGRKISANIAAIRSGKKRPILQGVLSKDGQTQSQPLNLFKDFVFAESFDSYYCNNWADYSAKEVKQFIASKTIKDLQKQGNIISQQTNTNLLMRDMFRRTWNVFHDVHEILGSTSLSLAGNAAPFDELANIAAPLEEQGFALAGQGGYRGGGYNPLNWNRWLYTGDARASDEVYSAATTAAGQSFNSQRETIHAGLDVVGTFDPTPISDGLNGLGYAAMGDRSNAAISMAGMVPIIGDAAKAGRLARFAAKHGDEVVDGAVRLRHYTNVSSMKKIQNTNAIHAADNGRVYTTKATKKPLSPRTAESKLKIDQGKGNAYVDFDALPNEVEIVKNPLTGVGESTIKHGVDLTGRNPVFKKNR
jgi:hypothetical protein